MLREGLWKDCELQVVGIGRTPEGTAGGGAVSSHHGFVGRPGGRRSSSTS